jgi:hypothetical protein
VQYLGELGAEVRVVRNDEISVADIKVKVPISGQPAVVYNLPGSRQHINLIPAEAVEGEFLSHDHQPDQEHLNGKDDPFHNWGVFGG